MPIVLYSSNRVIYEDRVLPGVAGPWSAAASAAAGAVETAPAAVAAAASVAAETAESSS